MALISILPFRTFRIILNTFNVFVSALFGCHPDNYSSRSFSEAIYFSAVDKFFPGTLRAHARKALLPHVPPAAT